MIKLFDNIYGDKYNLVELDLKYLDDMFEYSSDDRLYEHFEFPPQKNYLNTKEYLENLIKRSNKDDAYWWFIQLKETSKVIGSFGIHEIDLRKGSCEISYAISPNYWGTGAFMDVLNMSLKHLFNDFNFHRVTAVTSSKNFRSINALKKVGFEEEGVFRDFYYDSMGERGDATPLALLSKNYIHK
ncbi:GNAT family N-acetyltransferase [Candidatus Pseudothioglobus singularis]|nr:GNAT family N-acetyltransferase [Candidatus Pseudothioglobus singularis]